MVASGDARLDPGRSLMRVAKGPPTTSDPGAAADARATASPPADGPPYVSVIVRVTERPVPLDEIYGEYAPAIAELDGGFEFVFALEPRSRPLADALRPLIERGEPIRIVEAPRGLGEANVLCFAADRSDADVILTLPAYHRVEPRAMPSLVREIAAGADLAVARRWPRADGWLSRVRSHVFNRTLRRLVGHTTSDVACGVAAMRRSVLEGTPLYGDFFRFLPVLAAREGFAVHEVDAPQHPGDLRTRLYRPGIYVRRLIDILGLVFLVRFTEKPLRFFGLVGGGLSVAGLALLLILFVQRVFFRQPLADRPIVLVAIIAFTLGVQALALGLIGEMIVHLHASRGRRYRILEDDDPEGS